MDSEATRERLQAQRSQRARLRLALTALLLCISSGLALTHLDQARLLVLSGLATIGLAAWGWRQLRRLQLRGWVAEVEPSFGRSSAQAQKQVQEQSNRVQAQLDQAPVALWWRSAQELEPLNNAARRVLAPGGLVDHAAFVQALLQAGGGRRHHEVLMYDTERGQERGLLAINPLILSGSEGALLALMPIESELEAERLKAWRQLVHVLTHEIMNSLTPIASLSRTAQELLLDEQARGQLLPDDVHTALEAVARRAESLARFVSNYRRVSELPEPQREAVSIQALFARLEQMVASEWRERGGLVTFSVEPGSLSMMADAGQLEQALLNLIKNAAQATSKTAAPELKVTAHLARGARLVIELRDNGPGVPSGLESDIFLPFFSTKQNNEQGGQGIGLAVVRNLVHGMGGKVRYVKPVGGGACFVLSF